MRVRAYWLDLRVDHRSGQFGGEVRIELEDSARAFTLDAVDLSVHSVHVDGAEASFQLQPAEGKLAVEASSDHPSECRIRFSGVAQAHSLTGPYLSRLGNGSLWTTMLYPAGCRRLFPCFDEPTQKAVFHVSVSAEPDVRVISNAPAESVAADGGRRQWRFEPTPRMSTYLLYIGVGAFEEVRRQVDGLETVVATAPGFESRAEYAAQHAPSIVRAFERYYQIPYPLPKLHLVAVPDFWPGGMENWGAIAFAERLLLVDSGTTPELRRWVFETMAHEIAHQWFGNLVTMAWWNDFWLNESFATFAAYRIAEQLDVEPDMWYDAYRGFFDLAFLADGFSSTHAVAMPVRHPDETLQIASGVTYGKGAAVLRMIERFIGEGAFRAGLTAYLRRFSYSNARSEDLWSSLEEVAHEPVREIMDTWVRRPGHPVVSVRPAEGGVELEQRRFSFDPRVEPEEPWPIPLGYEADGILHRAVFQDRTIRIPARDLRTFRINPEREGFYRVDLDPRLAAAMPGLLDLSPTDRWARLNDAGSFVLAGRRPLEEFLELVQTVQSSADFLTISEVEDWLGRLHWILPRSNELSESLLRFVRTQLDRVGESPRPNEPRDDSIIRERLLTWRVLLDPAFARGLAPRLGEANELEPALRGAVVLARGAVGGERAVVDLEARLLSDTNEERMGETIMGLGFLPHPRELSRALSLVLDPRVRLGLGTYLLGALARNPAGREVGWEWLQGHLPEYERRAEGTPLCGLAIEHSIPFLGLGRVQEIHEYFRDHPVTRSTRNVERSLAVLDVYDRLRVREGGPGNGELAVPSTGVA